MTLQQQWDIWLVANFDKYPSTGIRKCIHFFERKMCLDEGHMFKSEIKRVPKKEGAGSFCTVSRFVCGYINGASEFMFDKDKNAIQRAAILSRCGDSTVDPVDVLKTSKETMEKQKAKRDLRIANQEYKLGNAQRAAYARRNWSACK